MCSGAAGTPTSQPQTPMADPDAGSPPVVGPKHEAALTALSAGVQDDGQVRACYETSSMRYRAFLLSW
jgi:hypothetical protein